MSAVVVHSARVGRVVGVRIVDEVSYLFTFLFVVLNFILVVDLGFYVDEGVATVATALAAMALNSVSFCSLGATMGTYLLDIFVLVILFLFFLIIVVVIVATALVIIIAILVVVFLYVARLGSWRRIVIIIAFVIVRTARPFRPTALLLLRLPLAILFII